MTPSTSRALPRYTWLWEILLLAVIMGAAYSQHPLFYVAQNQYVFHGLARLGFGHVGGDWVATTPDPWPVFTRLVELTYRHLDAGAFYLFFALLLGVYAYSLLGIADALFNLRASRGRYLAHLALFVGTHSVLLSMLSARFLGLNLSRLLIDGVASQRILWDMFQPGAFGAFMLLAVLLFLRGKPYAAGLANVVAVAFNPTYLLSAGILTLAFLVAMSRRERLHSVLGVGLWTLVLVLPVVAYMYLAFRPTGAEVWAQAQEILARFRLARHAHPPAWFGDTVVLQLGVVAAGLYAARRSALFVVLAICAAVAASLTMVQVLTQSNTLALLYPWRMSVVLLPLSTTVGLAALLSTWLDGAARSRPRIEKALAPVSIAALVVLMGAGAAVTAQRFAERSDPEIGVKKAARESAAPGDLYLIPIAVSSPDPQQYGKALPRWQYFRLISRAPVFVDYWFVPYNDAAVLEWYRRVRIVDQFYTDAQGRRCPLARRLQGEERVTHVVLRTDDPDTCANWTPIFRDRHYTLYRMAPLSRTVQP